MVDGLMYELYGDVVSLSGTKSCCGPFDVGDTKIDGVVGANGAP